MLLFALLPLRAQDKTSKANHDPTTTQKVEQKSADTAGVQILNSVTPQPQAEKKPEGFWNRFFSPENIPNIILCVIGLIGIPVAVRTLIMLQRQTGAMQDTLDVSRRTLILQFRPILSVTGIRAMGFFENPKNPETKEVFIGIENTGGADAHITDSEIVVKVVDYSIAMFSLMDGAISLDKKTLKPGQGHVTSIPIDDGLAKAIAAEAEHPDNPHWDGHKLIYCMGNVIYRDDLDIVRTLRLYRRFDPITFEFIPINSSDSEYKSSSSSMRL